MKNCCFSSPKLFAAHFITLKMPFVICDNRANCSICLERDYFNYGLNVLFSASDPQRRASCRRSGARMHIKGQRRPWRYRRRVARAPIDCLHFPSVHCDAAVRSDRFLIILASAARTPCGKDKMSLSGNKTSDESVQEVDYIKHC